MSTDKTVYANFAFNITAQSVQGAKAFLDGSGGVLVIDVSTATEFAASHLLCAKNYVWTGSGFSPDIAALSSFKDEDILVYDQTGVKSQAAANYMAGQGFTSVYYLTDGLDDWIAEGYETFTTAEDVDICTSLTPMAYAGADQTVNENASVTLRGSGTGSSLSYEWTQVEGTSVTLSNNATAQPTFTAPNLNGGNTTLVFHLTVMDSLGKKDTDSVAVDVNWVNGVPVARAGDDQTVTPGARVILDASGSKDPENSIASYQWERSSVFGGGAFPDSLTGPKPFFMAPSTEGWVIYKLTVVDNGGLTDTDTVKVTVNAGDTNTPPTANAGNDQTVTEGAIVTLDGSGSTDFDGTIASYAWTRTAGPSVTLSNSSAAKPTFTAPGVSASTKLTFSLTVTDNDGATSIADPVEVTVNDNPGPNPDDKDKDGYTPAQGDCDDNNAAIHPGAPEICGDGKDNNCDGNTDEGCSEPWAGNYAVQIQAKLSVKKWAKASSTVNGQLTLQDNGTFFLEDSSTSHDMSGVCELDAKKKSILYELNAAGLTALEDHLIEWLEAAAAAQGLTLSDLDYTFTKTKTSKVKIDKNTQRATGKMKFTVSGTVSGCVAGEDCGEMKFTYKANVLIN